MGGGPKTKTNSQYEARLTEVWRMWNRDQRQWQIAAALGITDRQVRYDLKTLENRWRKETSAGMAALKEAELAKLHELELTYWDSWEKSCGEKQTTSTSQSEGDEGIKRKAALKKENRDGNPAFLAGIERCIERRCKILGLDAPITIGGPIGFQISLPFSVADFVVPSVPESLYAVPYLSLSGEDK